jgi:hypothetical protein
VAPTWRGVLIIEYMEATMSESEWRAAMSHSRRIALSVVVIIVAALAVTGVPHAQQVGGGPQDAAEATIKSGMTNPYRMLENWPRLGNIKPGAAIGIVPDGKGGVWLHHRSEPPILQIDASGAVVKSFGNGM